MNESKTAENPLLRPEMPIPYDAIRAEHVEPAIQELLKRMSSRIEEIGSETTPRTYQDVILGLDHATEPLDYAMALVKHLEADSFKERMAGRE